jgi:RNA-directed DNA polymerase
MTDSVVWAGKKMAGKSEATPLGVPQGGPLSPLLANITLDPLDKEIERRGHVHARYADDFIILVEGEKKAQRVMESITRFIERKLKLVVNRTKSKSGPLIESSVAFAALRPAGSLWLAVSLRSALGFCISSRGSIKWTAKAYARFKQRIKEITRRNRGHAVQTVIDELRRYAVGWMNYFGISRTYREVLELDDWIRRRVRLYHWTALPRQRHPMSEAKPQSPT